MGKFATRCSRSSCCRKKTDEKNVIELKDLPYFKNPNKDIKGLLSSKNKDNYNLTISELICHEPLPKCAEKVTDLTLLLANVFISGENPFDHPEFKEITAKTNEKWPNVGQLNFLSGLEAIENYIESLHYDPMLKYCINFIMQKVDELSSAFYFEVKWSLPIKEEPIQLATASMFFCLKMFCSMNNESPIEVSYVYEYSNIVLHPGEVKFKESWLLEIIQNKLDFCKNNNFKMDDYV